jgi:hypothetical protein
MAILHFGGKHGEKLRRLFAMLGQDNDGEFDNARRKVSDMLAVPRFAAHACCVSIIGLARTRTSRSIMASCSARSSCATSPSRPKPALFTNILRLEPKRGEFGRDPRRGARAGEVEGQHTGPAP